MTAAAPTMRRVEIRNATVGCYDTGDGGPPLLLHGFPFSKFFWRDVIGRLSDPSAVLRRICLLLRRRTTSPTGPSAGAPTSTT